MGVCGGHIKLHAHKKLTHTCIQHDFIQPYMWMLKVLIQHLLFESVLFVLSSSEVILVMLMFTTY